jgi:hypothetical protein
MSSSGDVGFCRHKNKMIGLIINWNGHTVESVECEHDTCGFAQICKLYQRHPVGHTEEFHKND